MRASIPIRILKGLNLVASTDPTRWILNGVQIARHGDKDGYACATDGRSLAVMRIDCRQFEGEGELVIPSSIIRRLRAGKKSEETVEVCGAAKTIRYVRQDGITFGFDPTEVLFPRWRGVVPKGPSCAQARLSFNAELLQKLQKAAVMASGVSGGIHIVCHGDLGPYSIQHESSDFYAILMPILAREPGVPSWVETIGPDAEPPTPEPAPEQAPTATTDPTHTNG